jgi:hypothetical protein
MRREPLRFHRRKRKVTAAEAAALLRGERSLRTEQRRRVLALILTLYLL